MLKHISVTYLYCVIIRYVPLLGNGNVPLCIRAMNVVKSRSANSMYSGNWFNLTTERATLEGFLRMMLYFTSFGELPHWRSDCIDLYQRYVTATQ